MFNGPSCKKLASGTIKNLCSTVYQQSCSFKTHIFVTLSYGLVCISICGTAKSNMCYTNHAMQLYKLVRLIES